LLNYQKGTNAQQLSTIKEEHILVATHKEVIHRLELWCLEENEKNQSQLINIIMVKLQY